MDEKLQRILLAPFFVIGVLLLAVLALGTAVGLVMLTVVYFPWSIVGWAVLLALSALINRSG